MARKQFFEAAAAALLVIDAEGVTASDATMDMRTRAGAA